MENNGVIATGELLNSNEKTDKTLESNQILQILLQRVRSLDVVLRSTQACAERLEMQVSELYEKLIVKAQLEEIYTPTTKITVQPLCEVCKPSKNKGKFSGDPILERSLSALSWWIDAYAIPVIAQKNGEKVSTSVFFPSVRDGHSFTTNGYQHIALPHFLNWVRVQQQRGQRDLYPDVHMTQPRLCQLLQRAGWKANMVHATLIDETGQKLWRQRRYWCKPV